MRELFQRGVKCDFEFVAPARGRRGGAGELFASGIVQFQLEDARHTGLPVLHVHVGPEHFAFFIQEEDDAVELRAGPHHVEFARPFLHRDFIVAQEQDNRLALVFLIDEGRRVSESGRGVVKGQ